ncbi:MAG: ATP-binding cassette domain-containing protein [Thiohalocapsa sp.]
MDEASALKSKPPNSANSEAVLDDAPPLLPLEVRGITYKADGLRLIDELYLTLRPGPLTVVMGPNGAGKSLLLRLLHGLLTPSNGEIRWHGGTADGEALRRRQAMVFQRPVLLRRSVRANLDFALHVRGRRDPARRDELLRFVGLAERAQQPARLLSGGEQQRLALARALATEPELLLLDEPTASLDPSATAAIERLVLAAHRDGTKILFVTHDLGQARRLADEVLFLNHGKVTEQTDAERFFQDPASQAAADYLSGRLVF